MVVPEAGPELSVVCKNCGSEVSPYVTECPYCGTRLRKRAPKLERQGDELTPAREPPHAAAAGSRPSAAPSARERLAVATERPYVTVAAILGPAILLLVQRGADAERLPGRGDRRAHHGRDVALPRGALRLRPRSATCS